MSCAPDLLTETLQSKLSKPESSPDFDLHGGVEQVLKDVGMVTADCGGKLSFFGRDPIIPSSFRFGAMAAIGLAAKAIAAASLWRSRTGEGQDIAVDVRLQVVEDVTLQIRPVFHDPGIEIQPPEPELDQHGLKEL